MSDLIVENPESFGIPKINKEGKLRVLELGAGTGLVGLTIAHLLRIRQVNSEVVLTDFHPSVLQNLRRNVEANFPESLPEHVHVTSTQLDWSKFPNGGTASNNFGTFDLIVGSDIIYEEEHAIWVKACLELLLPNSAIFYLLIPLRPTHTMESATISAVFSPSPASTIKNTLSILNKSSFFCHTEDGKGEVEYAMYSIGWS